MRAPRGLSLIELVVALAVFALIATMGLQALTGMLRLRDDLGARADRAERLGRATALLRADLSAVMPLLFYPPGAPLPQSAVAFDARSGLALSLGGQPRFDAAADDPGLQRVEWRRDPATGALQRRAWDVLYPAAAGQAGPPVTMLDGVTGLSLRSYWDGVGWIDGARPEDLALLPAVSADPGGADTDRGPAAAVLYSDQLPRALELAIETEAFGRITLVEALP